MKKIINYGLLSMLLFCTGALADPSIHDSMRTPGWYVTFAFGSAVTGYSDQADAYGSSFPSGNGLNLQFFPNTSLGYQITVGHIWNRYFDTEFSYYGFGGASQGGGSFFGGNADYTINSNVDFDQRALALAAVGRLPLGSTMSDFYAKLGLAYTWTTLSINYSTAGEGPTWNPGQLSYNKNFSAGTIAPLAALGWELNMGHHWAISLEALGVFSAGKSLGDPLNSKMSSAALYSFGTTYKF